MSNGAGVSGLDGHNWGRMCLSYDASDALCDAIRLATIRIASEKIDFPSLEGFVADRLAAMDKCPACSAGVRLMDLQNRDPGRRGRPPDLRGSPWRVRGCGPCSPPGVRTA